MSMSSLRTKLGLAAIAAIGILAPLSFSPARGVTASGAACATCCPQSGAKCVVCGTKSCSSFDESYEAKVGSPCERQM